MMTARGRRLGASLICLLLIMMGAPAIDAQRDDPLPLRAIPHEGYTRSYLLYVPETYTETEPVPLVLVFHGAGANAESMVNGTELRDLADNNGTIIAYLNAVNGRWDYLDVPLERGGTVVDDVGFAALLIDELSGNYSIDQDRIYTMGYSNGALMAFRVRCTLDDRIAATGLVGASMTYGLAQLCIGAAPVPTAFTLGTDDPVFPLNGYAEIDNGILYSGFSHIMTFSYLASLNQCELAMGRFKDVTASAQSDRMIVQEPAGCASDDLIRFYVVAEVGHVWPDALVMQSDETVVTVPAAIWSFLHERALN